MGVTGEHDDALDAVPADFVVEDRGCGVGFITELDEAMAGHHRDVFELRMVPVFALDNPGLGDVDADLPPSTLLGLIFIENVNNLGEGTTGINIHLVVDDCFFLWQVAEECCHQLIAQ